jgi:ubiquitin
MLIFIKTLTNKIFTLDVDMYDLIADVKVKITNLYGVPPDNQRFIFAGRNIEDTKTLEYYNMQEESTLYLVFRKHPGI